MQFLQRCFRGNKSKEKNPQGGRLLFRQKFCHGVGHTLNDLAANAWFSYLIIFLTKVARLSNSHTGLVVMLGQVTDGVCTPITAILNDKTVCRYGRRKIWHLLGSICVTLTFPLLFTRLLSEETSDSYKLAYYIGIAAVFQFGWGCVQISHLSLIPEIAASESEKVQLNALRSALRFVCGIFVFGVTWILLGRSSEENISPVMWKQFMYLALIIIGTGNVFNVIFHVGIKEPPSDALLCWLAEREKRKRNHTKHRNSGPESRASLLKAVYQQPTPSRRSGASPLVVMSICEKQSKNFTCVEPAVSTNSTNNMENGNVTHSNPEIINKSSILGGGRTKMQWLKGTGIYKMGVLYICTRLYVNVSQSYLPLYLTETLKFKKEAIAYFPLVVLITGVFSSTLVNPLNKRLGSKITFCLGAMVAVSASFWFYVQNVDGRKAVYGTVMLMGCGGSVMLVTSLSLIAQLIGQDKKSGAFVYGFIGFFDKVFSGAVFAIIQYLNPDTEKSTECSTCDKYVRHVQSLVPGVVGVVGLFFVMIFFDSIFVCKRRADSRDAAVQTNFTDSENDNDSDVESRGLRRTHKTTNAECNLGSFESGLSHKRTYDSSFECRNFGTPLNIERGYVAMRLASSVIPSPILERRTVL